MFLIFHLFLLLQALLSLFFMFFVFYNCRYQIASFFKPKIKKVPPSNAKVAIVIVSRNEKRVIGDTIGACMKLNYPNKTIIVGDDSNDIETMEVLRTIANNYHCQRLNHTDYSSFIQYSGIDEAYESEQFVLFHRENNLGFKAGNVKLIENYLKIKGFDYMYLLDADWHPESHTIEKCLEVIEADPCIAYIQTKRNSYSGKGEHFRKCLALMEESCYYVDLVGRQVLGDMILFTGCCALFRLSYLYEVGGFMPGHLTEDIDLSNRFYLAGYKGVYLDYVENLGEVPPNYKAYRKQQDRWTKGSARVLRDYVKLLIKSKKMNLKTKLSILRQNAYFTVAVGTELSMVLSVISMFYNTLGKGIFSNIGFVNVFKSVSIITIPMTYLFFFSGLIYLVILIVKKREWLSFFYIPFVWWINLSIIHTYFIANILGLKNGNTNWFLTPKTNRTKQKVYLRGDWRMKVLNLISLILIVATYYISITTLKSESSSWLIIPYVITWIPAFAIGTIKS